MSNTPPPIPPLHPETRIGHIHLKVTNLERSLHFYRDILGFTETQRFGDSAAFLSAGGDYHHHIGLNTWYSKDAAQSSERAPGLYHAAILYPSRKELADALRRLIANNIPLDGAADHGVSEALYLHDPDNNGIELYTDRPPSQWPRTPTGQLNMTTLPLDLTALLNENP